MIAKTQNINDILVATDKFKGCLKAGEAARAIASGLQKKGCCQVHVFPMADGGEGSLELLESCFRAQEITVEKIWIDTVNPLGYALKAPFLLQPQTHTAYVEMALVSGLSLVPEEERNILRSTTFGLGEMVRAAIEDHGARKVVMMVGGSATNDAGFGLLTALGFRYTNDSVFKNKNTPTFLVHTTAINNSFVSAACPHLYETEFVVATDVTNPLLGDNGASRVYAPQKGATPENVEFFEEAIANWSQVLLHCDPSLCVQGGGQKEGTDFPGAGAAGGIGFALHCILGAEVVSGWRLLAHVGGLEEAIAQAQYVITGEGCLDEQSLNGKLPMGILEMARKYGKPVAVLCGDCALDEVSWKKTGFAQVHSLMEWAAGDRNKAFSQAAVGLEELAAEMKL